MYRLCFGEPNICKLLCAFMNKNLYYGLKCIMKHNNYLAAFTPLISALVKSGFDAKYAVIMKASIFGRLSDCALTKPASVIVLDSLQILTKLHYNQHKNTGLNYLFFSQKLVKQYEFRR